MRHIPLHTDQELDEYVVLLKFNSQANTLAVTYANKKSNKVTQIDELDAAENIISTSYFKGRSCSGFCSQDIKDMKPLIAALKPKDWLVNEGIYIDSYHRIH